MKIKQKSTTALLSWAFLISNISTAPIALAGNNTSPLAGSYVLTDDNWLPSHLKLEKSGKFQWNLYYNGHYNVSGTWNIKDEKINLIANKEKGHPKYQPYISDQIRFRHPNDVIGTYIIGTEIQGITGDAAIFEDEKGQIINGETDQRNRGLLTAKKPPSWGPWKRVALKRIDGEDKWNWFSVTDAAQESGIMPMMLKNSNKIAPAFNNILLSLNNGENDELILSMPKPEIKENPFAKSIQSLSYRKQEKPIKEKFIIGKYTSSSTKSELWLEKNHRAAWYSQFDYLEGKWHIENGLVKFTTELPKTQPTYRLMTNDEEKIIKPATNEELIIVVGVPKAGGAEDIEVQFQSNGKILGHAVSNSSGDAILRWNGSASDWTKVGLRRNGSHDSWSWFDIPPERRSKRIVGVAINDLGLLKPFVSELWIGQSQDGGLILLDPLMKSALRYTKKTENSNAP